MSMVYETTMQNYNNCVYYFQMYMIRLPDKRLKGKKPTKRSLLDKNLVAKDGRNNNKRKCILKYAKEIKVLR